MSAPVQPYPGYAVVPARVAPRPGQVVIGYEIVMPKPGCCAWESLSPKAMVLAIALVYFFWPAAFLICFIPSMHLAKQRPVFGGETHPSASTVPMAPLAHPLPHLSAGAVPMAPHLAQPQPVYSFGQVGQQVADMIDWLNPLQQPPLQFYQPFPSQQQAQQQPQLAYQPPQPLGGPLPPHPPPLPGHDKAV